MPFLTLCSSFGSTLRMSPPLLDGVLMDDRVSSRGMCSAWEKKNVLMQALQCGPIMQTQSMHRKNYAVQDDGFKHFA